jgi:hypothetical protein
MYYLTSVKPIFLLNISLIMINKLNANVLSPDQYLRHHQFDYSVQGRGQGD